ncbi:MAG: glycosyltransferase [Phycisphaeraceae bacterium]|nr:glycosyltransferase [Phycisphaeraceae bacterium]
MMPTPRLSILIPNFNNGPASSKDGKTDLIGDLLQSLWDTLHDDPTPFEILAFDDGSTDESLKTLRDWSQKTWRGGEPFLTLMEDEHCGILSITANKLVRASKGEFLARLDGDIVIHTKNWAATLCEAFDTGPKDLAVIGPKQLTPDGKVHSMGDFILHPKGYHHLCAGLPSDMVTRAVEVDHVMGCFYCCTRALYDELDGYDEDYMRGQTVDFGMRSRLAGYRCWAIPTIEFTHRHTLRLDRATTADSEVGVDNSRQVFCDKWGFDRIAPDLDVARERYANTPLLWNAQVFGVPAGADTIPASAVPASFETSEWARFNQDKAFAQWVMFKVGSVVQMIEQGFGPKDRPVVVPDCGSGIVVQILATRGVEAIGIEREIKHIEMAKEFVRHHTTRGGYPGKAPRFIHQTELRELPLGDSEAGLVGVFDRMEAHDNPVSLLQEARRVSGEDGAVLAISKTPALEHEQPMHPYRPPTPLQMAGLIMAATGWRTVIEVQKQTPGTPMVVLATDRTMTQQPKPAEDLAPMTMQPATTG